MSKLKEAFMAAFARKREAEARLDALYSEDRNRKPDGAADKDFEEAQRVFIDAADDYAAELTKAKFRLVHVPPEKVTETTRILRRLCCIAFKDAAEIARNTPKDVVIGVLDHREADLARLRELGCVIDD